MENLRCGGCAKLLGKADGYRQIQIKCPRCGVLNHMKAQSLSSDRLERHEEGSTLEERTDPRRCPDRPADPAGRELRRPHH
ncbi:TPA: Com family DNA-binding transcriptional regulator [Stenotrophomonas maltophilia]